MQKDNLQNEQIFTFNLPDIGEGVVEGEVIEWLKKVGDTVKQDEPVVVVMTDKATVELPSPYPGTILKHYFKPGEISIKGKPLYDVRLESGAAQIVSQKKASPEKPIDKGAAGQIIGQKQCPQETASGERALAIPKVRRTAQELGIDLEGVVGTGKHGEITIDDLKKVQSTKIPHSSPKPLEGDEEQPLIGIRGLMARKMDQFHIPQFSYFEQVDVTRLIQLRNNSKLLALQEGMHLSYMPFFIRALALTAKQFPQMNSSIDIHRNVLIFHKQLNVGMAMATPQGLIVPVLKGVQEMKLKNIVDGYTALKDRAKAGKLSSTDMKEATVTLSNFGSLGEGCWATPMISPPEVAILAVARIVKAPIVKNNEVVIRDMLALSWSFDHRVIDGELAAYISHHFCRLLRDPLPLI